MDQKQFIERLQALAELQMVKVPATGGRREADEADCIFRNGQKISIDPKNNPTLNIAVKKIKHQKTNCTDCGVAVVDRIVEKRRCEHPVPHWRHRCANCGLYQHPETGLFEMRGAHQVQLAWTNHLNAKIKSKSQGEK